MKGARFDQPPAPRPDDRLPKGASVAVKTRGLRFIEHRRLGTYVSLADLLDALAAIRRGAVEADQSVYVLDQLRTAILESHARSA